MEHKKQSEIGLAQNLISKLAQLPSGQTFSLAALHTQTATVQAIGLSWVYGGNVAIAEFSPSLNFNIW